MSSTYRKTAAAVVAGILAAGNVHADTIRFWTTEEQPERLARQQEMADEFRNRTGHTVEVIPVSEKDLGQRTTAAYAANDLPDVIYHTLQYVLPWAEAGILDIDTNNDIVAALGRDTFAQGALEMAEFDGLTPAVPVDGWTQMVVYRKDWFDSYGLAPPNSYANIQAAIEQLHNPPDRYGFVAATKVDENFMSQVLEHVFLANGATPVSTKGFKPFDFNKTTEVLEFYKALAQASPPGELYWKQSRELFFAGRAAMIIWSPFILDELAGLRDSAPPTINDDPTSRDLAERTSVVTTFGGPSNKGGAAWADIRFFGVTSTANTDVAADFVSYAMDDGYVKTLGIAPEGKFPVRRGDSSDPTKFVKAWSQLPVGVDRKAPLGSIYPQETIDTIVAGLETANRWGVQEGQLSLASKIINSQVINRVVRQYIDGEMNAQQAVTAINEQLARID